jgi:hypothetical protein
MMERIDSRLLDALRREPHASELAREAETVAAMAAAVRSVPINDSFKRRSGFMLIQPLRARTVALLAATMLAGTSALALAGSLPAPAQEVVENVLGELGLSLPDQAGGADPVADTPAEAEKGLAIAALASGSDERGVERGALVSQLASDGKSRAGAAGPGAAAEAPVATPNEGGTPTADAASDGASEPGTTVADAKSDGKSAAGSGNADVAPVPESGAAAESGLGTAAGTAGSTGLSTAPSPPSP